MKPRILVLDGNADECTSLLECLRQGGFEAVGAGSLQQARGFLDSQRFDMLLLEVMLPDGNGLSFCDQLRERLGAGILIICVSGDSRSSTRIAGLQLGADDFVLKPFDPDELLARIHAKLRRWHPLPGT